MDPVVKVDQVSKRFKLYKERYHTLKERVIFFKKASAHEEFWGLRDVSLDIASGTTYGLIGANGSGKTTLLKLIAGILHPTSGSIEVKGRISALLELGAGFHQDLTGRENVFLNGSILGLSKKEVASKFDSIVDFAELHQFIDNPVRNYSSGMYVRLGFAVAVHVDPDILLVDEVLAVGDEPFQEKCLGRIRQFQREGRTIILVTHAVDLVREIADGAALLDHGELIAHGNPAEVVRTYRDRMRTTPTGETTSVVGNITIEEIRILGAGGQATSTLDGGQPMGVEIDLVALEAVKDPVISVNIHDSAGQHIFGTNSLWRDLHVDFEPGPARVRAGFGPLPMREGRFTFTVMIHSADQRTIYALTEPGVHFDVRSDTLEPGRLYVPCTLSVEGAAVKHGPA